MKVNLQTDEITLSVNGREMTFSEKELTYILEEHFKCEKSKVKQNVTEVTQIPTEGKWFRVSLLTIDPNLFREKRSDSMQESTRQLILEAFEEVKKNSKYTKPFKTMILQKTWSSKTVGELEKLARKLGDRNADWVEQALEWAQRIANGESWEDICNKADTSSWYRLVVWKNGYVRIVGGSHKRYNNNPVSCVLNYDLCDYGIISYSVPLVVLYE